MWACRLNYPAGALFLLNVLANLIGWDSFANRPRGDAYLNLGLSVVFFSVGTVFMPRPHKANCRQGPGGQISN